MVLRNAPAPMYGRGRRVIEKVNYKGGEIPRITSSLPESWNSYQYI
jgi:hypothetical protein